MDESVYDLLGGSQRRDIDPSAVSERLSLMMVNEAVRCLEEEVIGSARDGDLGAVLGLGFPPFRGGPFHHVDALGATMVVDRLRELESRHGPRFRPADLLVEMAERGSRFYSERPA